MPMNNKCSHDLYVVYCFGKYSTVLNVCVKSVRVQKSWHIFHRIFCLQTQDTGADFFAYGILTELL